MILKKFRITTLVFFIFVFSFSFSQEKTIYDVAAELKLKGSSPEIKALGSPYVNKKFQPVKIKNYSNSIYSGRYNAYNGEMEIIVSGNKTIALDINAGDFEVVFVNEKKIYQNHAYTTQRGISKKDFLVNISTNETVQLLKKEKIKYQPKEAAASSYQQEKPAKFSKGKDEYYLKIKDADIYYFPTKKKEILKAFPKHSKEISAFIKKNKIKTSKEEDLIKLANYIGTL